MARKKIAAYSCGLKGRQDFRRANTSELGDHALCASPLLFVTREWGGGKGRLELDAWTESESGVSVRLRPHQAGATGLSIVRVRPRQWDAMLSRRSCDSECGRVRRGEARHRQSWGGPWSLKRIRPA